LYTSNTFTINYIWFYFI